jgi:hypothetical protein
VTVCEQVGLLQVTDAVNIEPAHCAKPTPTPVSQNRKIDEAGVAPFITSILQTVSSLVTVGISGASGSDIKDEPLLQASELQF